MEKQEEPKKLIEAWKKTSVDLLQEAKTNYRQMQRGWWFFAKCVHEIKKSKAYETSGFETFKEFCEKEYAAISYTTMFKYVSIVEHWQSIIDMKLSKNPNFSLPAYETCYSVLTISKDEVPEEEINKLKKQVIDSRITYSEVRKKVKDLRPQPTHEENEQQETEDNECDTPGELINMADMFLEALRTFDKTSLPAKQLKFVKASLKEVVNECEKFIY